MISRIFPQLTRYAWFRRFIWKRLYNRMARSFPTEKWTFMNYGYDYPGEPIKLDEKDEINRYSIQLYLSLIERVDFETRNILEVGSGRGGGSNYIAGKLTTGQITGMDLAEASVSFCQKNYQKENLQYVAGNSEKMPFGDSSFDIVINVESSHAYGSVDNFLGEVNRVLCSSGYFLLADFRDKEGITLLREQLAQSGLKLINEIDITENVIGAIEKEDAIKRDRIRQHIPAWINGLFGEFAGVTGSKVHTNLVNGALVYYQFVLQKIE